MPVHPRTLGSRAPKARGVLFDTLEEARAALALGAAMFRCSVCGRAHRSAGNGWRPCARRLAAEWGLLWDGPGMRPLAFVLSRETPLEPPPLGSPQVVLSVRRDVLAGAVRNARAAWRRVMKESLEKLGVSLAGKLTGCGFWHRLGSPEEVELAGLPGRAVWVIRSTFSWARGTEAVIWENAMLWVIAVADAVGRLILTRGMVWMGGEEALGWVLASTTSAEDLVRWMVHVLHAAGGRSSGGL